MGGTTFNKEYLAQRAWPILIQCAAQRKTMRYGELAQQLGIHHRSVRYVLGVIQNHCLEKHLPPLTILVHSANGKYGQGFIACAHDNIQECIEDVWQHNWQKNSLGEKRENPFDYAADGVTTLETLARRVLEASDTEAQSYALAKRRGIVQPLFGSILLQTYRGRCAFCGLNVKKALEAAHIVPWAETADTPQQRADPRNGVLLCATHHKLFDHGYLSISDTGRILCRGLNAAALQGLQEEAALPQNEKWRPDPQKLQQHRKRHRFPR